MASRFIRLSEQDRRTLSLNFDGENIEALEGDTLMVAILSNDNYLRHSEFGQEKRAGFCLMGACQDCWVWTRSGERLRACSTEVKEGMEILSAAMEPRWASQLSK